MSKFKLGDIFEISTGNGSAYFQCVHSYKLKGELIKVFNHIFEKRPKFIKTIEAVKDFYYVGFPFTNQILA